MPDAAKDTRVRRHGANANFELARLKLYLGDPVAAEQDARAAVEQTDGLVTADATNMFWLSEACFDRLRLAEVELALGRQEAARINVERASEDASRLIASDASMLNWQVNLNGLMLAQKARIALAERRGLPNDEIEAYLSKVRQVETSGKRFTSRQAELVAAIELISGDLLYRDEQRDTARGRWVAAVERLQPQSGGDDYPVLTLLARAQLRLGELAAARALAARVEASKYRHPAYADLVNELTLGAGPSQSFSKAKGN